jgi:hypothetical protein
MPFADHLDDMDDAVDAHVGDGALYFAGGTGEGLAVQVILERPTDQVTLDRTDVALANPIVEVRKAKVPTLRKGDVFACVGRRWRVEGAGTRPGDGRWWRAPVTDIGAAP